MGYRAFASHSTVLTKYTGCSTRLRVLAQSILQRLRRLLRRWIPQRPVAWYGLFCPGGVCLLRLVSGCRGRGPREAFLVLCRYG